MDAATPISLLGPWAPSDGSPLIIAGPCAVESREQVLGTALALVAAAPGGVHLFRAGLWKPRTSPGGFEGVGARGLPWLDAVRGELGLAVGAEVATPAHLERCLEHGLEAVWIGARTTASPFAVEELARAAAGNPLAVLVKNPLSPDLALWIGALERLQRAGVTRLCAVHRGFSAGAASSLRGAPMWRLPLELKARWPELPVLGDPSHMAGRRELVLGLSRAALELGLDGLMVEVHQNPGAARSDARQQLDPAAFARLLRRLPRRAGRGAEGVPAPADARLEALRRELDRVDEELLRGLARRWHLVDRVARIKREAGLSAYQQARMSAVLERWQARGAELGLPEALVESLYLALHEASLDEQVKLLSEVEPDPAAGPADDDGVGAE